MLNVFDMFKTSHVHPLMFTLIILDGIAIGGRDIIYYFIYSSCCANEEKQILKQINLTNLNLIIGFNQSLNIKITNLRWK